MDVVQVFPAMKFANLLFALPTVLMDTQIVKSRLG